MSSAHPASLDPHDFMSQCAVTRTRRGGPGGQRRNKVETAIRMEHKPSGISVTASERRSSEQNRSAAMFRLRIKVALDVRCTADRPYRPSALWNRRCRDRTISVSATHEDFPAMLAEALDVVAACAMDIAAASASLSCTSSQLVKFLKIEPEALGVVNRERIRRRLHPMR